VIKVALTANTDWYLYNFRLSLATYLREKGFDVTLVSPTGRYAPQLDEMGFRWIQWELSRRSTMPWKEVPALFSLAAIYRHEQIDLAHHHTIKPVLYGSIAARLAGVRSVVNSITGRGYVFLSNEKKAAFLRKIVKPIYRFALNARSYATIFENEDDKEYFIEEALIPPERTWLISGVGVDPERFFPATEMDGVPVVLLPGRLLWDKGVGVLVEAARLLHQTIKVRVALVGEPDPGNPTSIPESVINSWVQEGVVEWWGWKPNMNEIYQASHIVVSPSMYEGVPTTLLEAAASGRAIVATDIPGCRVVVANGVNGLIVPPNDPEEMANALKQLISDSGLRQRMGAAGRQIVLEKFTSSSVNEATLSVYYSVLEQNSH